MADLLLAEHAYQVEDFLRRGLGSQADWVALGPSAMAELDRRRIPYMIPEDVCDIEKLAAACLEGHRAMEWLSERLDDELLDKHPNLKAWGMRPFAFHMFEIALFCDPLRSRIFMLDALLRACAPGKVTVHVGRRWPPATLLRFDDRETLWAHALRLFARQVHVEAFPDPGGRSVQALGLRGRSPALASDFAPSLGTLRNRLLGPALRARWTGWRWRILSGGWQRKRSPVLIVIGGYEWDHVLPALRRTGFRILSISAAELKAWATERELTAVGGVSLGVPANAEIERCFVESGVSFYGLVRSRMDAIWWCFPKLCHAVRARMERLVRRQGICAVLRSSSPSAIDHTVNQSARSLGLPVFVWQHGFVGYDERISELYEYTDLQSADVVFAYGTGAAEGFRKRSAVSGPEILPLGSARLQALRGSAWPQKRSRRATRSRRRHIVYVTNDYSRNGWYLRTAVAFSDRTYFQDQSAIVEALIAWTLRRDPVVTAAIKLYPRRGSAAPAWAERVRGVAGVRIVKVQPSVRELLGSADAVILDLPTTTLLEALATSLPVFLVTRHWALDQVIWDMVARRVVCAASADELIGRMDHWLSTGQYPASLENEEFFEAFAVPAAGGGVAERAAAQVARRLAAFGHTRESLK